LNRTGYASLGICHADESLTTAWVIAGYIAKVVCLNCLEKSINYSCKKLLISSHKKTLTHYTSPSLL